MYVIEFYKGSSTRETAFYEKAGKERAINKLKEAGWQTTTDLPFAVMTSLKNDASMHIGSQSTLTNAMYGFMADIVAEEGGEYGTQNTKMIGKSKFLSPDLAGKIEKRARERYRRKDAAEGE